MARKKVAKPPRPPCYTCKYAIKRGNFRLCKIGKEGYKNIGEWGDCDEYETEDEV